MSTIAVTGRVVLALLAALFGVAAGLGALLGAATVTAWPPLYLLAGLAIFCAAYLLGLLLATRGISPSRKRRVCAVSFCAGTALFVVSEGTGCLVADLWYFTSMGNGSPNFVFMRLRGY